MKKKLFSLAAGLSLLGGVALMALPSHATSAAADCQTGATRSPGDVINVNPDGGELYSDGTTYGLQGSHGYIEAGTDGHVQGSSTDVALEGRATTAPSACVNGTTIL